MLVLGTYATAGRTYASPAACDLPFDAFDAFDAFEA
jgi:hypothetical protein